MRKSITETDDASVVNNNLLRGTVEDEDDNVFAEDSNCKDRQLVRCKDVDIRAGLSEEGSGVEGETMGSRERRRVVAKIVTLLCLAGILQGILVNGLINVVISSLERRFGIKSTESGLIASSYDIASFLCLLPVSYLGGRGTGSKPLWIGGGIGVMGLGSLLFAMPHFLTEPYNPTSSASSGGDKHQRNVALCNMTTSCGIEEAGVDNNYKFMFMTSQLLHGAGAAPLYTLGVTYIDENVGPEASAFYLGIFYTMGIVGPALGYSIGGQFLNIHTDFLRSPSSVEEGGGGGEGMRSGEPGWVGAWWLGFVVCGVGGLLLALPITLLPSGLPGVDQPLADQVCRSRLASRTSSFRSSVKSRSARASKADLDLATSGGPLPVGKELLSALVILFTNPTFLFVSVAGACEGFLMQGLATFLPKLLQNQYSLTESQAAINVGAVSVLAGGGGTLLGGIIVKKLGLKVRGLLKLTSTTQFVAVIFALGLLASCSTQSRLTGPDFGEDSECGRSCNCLQSDYSPVCAAGGQQFFNPCWAGCTGRDPLTGLYINCSCVVGPPRAASSLLHAAAASAETAAAGGAATSPSTSAHFDAERLEARPGLCPTSCSLLPVFLTSFFFTMMITFLANMPSLTATLRCVDPSVRSLALGIQWLLIRLLGTIPGPVAMGRLFDSNCAYWRRGCGNTTENCLVYDNRSLSNYIMMLTALCKGLSILTFLAGMRLYKPPSRDEMGPGRPELGLLEIGGGGGKIQRDAAEKETTDKEVKEYADRDDDSDDDVILKPVGSSVKQLGCDIKGVFS